MLIHNLVTLNILYYRLDYQNLIQEFLWQTYDVIPELPKIHNFLIFWKDNIEAVIKEVNVAYTYKHNTRNVRMYDLQ